MTMNLYERTKRMPKADFNQEFPTRASLRRARQEQQDSGSQEGAADKKAPGVSAQRDEFDSIPESKRQETRKPAAATSQKPVAPAAPATKKSAPSAKTGSSSAETRPARNVKDVKKADKATPGSAKPGATSPQQIGQADCAGDLPGCGGAGNRKTKQRESRGFGPLDAKARGPGRQQHAGAAGGE